MSLLSQLPPLDNYFWLFVLVVLWINGAVLWLRSRADIKEHPFKEATYRELIRNFVLYGSVPWLIMGGGLLSGQIKEIDEYILPHLTNHMFVWAFYSSSWVLIARLSYWFYFKQGAEILFHHQALLRRRHSSLNKLKGEWTSVLIVGTLINIVVWLLHTLSVL